MIQTRWVNVPELQVGDVMIEHDRSRLEVIKILFNEHDSGTIFRLYFRDLRTQMTSVWETVAHRVCEIEVEEPLEIPL